MLNKKDYIKLLEKIAVYMELGQENPFKISAYRKAAGSLEAYEGDINQLEDFSTLKGIGKGVSQVLDEYRTEGKSEVLETLQANTPEGFIKMLKIRNLGAKKIVKIHEALGIETVEDLKLACTNHEISTLPGFGKKSEENILAGIEEMLTMSEKMSIYQVYRFVNAIDGLLENCKEVIKYSVAGSHRRKNEFSGDIDYIVACTDRSAVSEHIKSLPFIKKVELAGSEKMTVQVEMDDIITTVDFRYTDEAGYAHMLQHFTGSKDHNIKIRQLAKDKGEKINEYGITKTDGSIIQYKNESEIYGHFGVTFIPPETRNDGSEFDYKHFDKLITLKDIKGDIHMHTTASDGAHSLKEMIEACIERGYEYMCITDHSKSLFVANGLPEDKLLKQVETIHQLNEEYKEIDIYAGIEMDILGDGSMDYSDEILSQLDYCIGAIHQSLGQSEEDIMKRLINACHNPYVRHIAHPTGRLIGRRKGYNVNIEQLVETARQTNTVLEINAHPMRLDLSSEVLKQYPDLKLTINTDAHSINDLNLMHYGIGTAIKGYVKKEQVINTMNRKEFKQWLKNGK